METATEDFRRESTSRDGREEAEGVWVTKGIGRSMRRTEAP
jgi:hypothetical protein